MTTRVPAIYVDVDDTLIRSVGTKRIPIPATVALVKALSERGAALFLWSRGGATYAREVAEELKVADCFEAFLPKPQLLLDDRRRGPGAGEDVTSAGCLRVVAPGALRCLAPSS